MLRKLLETTVFLYPTKKVVNTITNILRNTTFYTTARKQRELLSNGQRHLF